MAKVKTKVILQKSQPNLGLVGDVISVNPGYYRNYLEPRKIALIANPSSIKQLEHHKKIIEAKKASEKKVAQEAQAKMEGKVYAVHHAAGTGERLFGSITNVEIAATLAAEGIEIDRKLIQLEAPIKTLGQHEVGVRLHPDVVAKIKIEVIRKEGESDSESA